MRQRLLPHLLLLVGLLAAAALPVGAQVVGSPGDPVYVVYPTGNYPADRDNVQQALDNVGSPGTVIMKSTAPNGAALAFNFGGTTTTGTGGVIVMARPDILLTGEGWNHQLDEPKTKIVGGGGPHSFSANTSGAAMVFAVKAPGIAIRELKLTSTAAATGVFIVSTTAFPASDHPVVVEHNHFDVVNFCVLTAYSAAFPVRIDHNKFIGNASIEARWMGFTLRSIASYPGDEPVVPRDVSGGEVRHGLEITDNTIIKRPGSTNWSTLTVYGWLNYGCPERGPETACRRFQQSSSSPFVYQYGDGDNGPVLISGNDLTVSTPGVTVWTILLGSESGGVNDVILWRNKVTGVCSETLVLGPYGHNNIIMDNDFSGVRAWTQAAILAADTIVYSNSFGALDPIPPNKQQVPPGFLPPVLFLASAQYYPAYTPAPNRVERCLIARNDYRPSGAPSEAILIASRAEFPWARYGATGTEVMNNVIFESGGFPPGSGGASRQIVEVDRETNPATGLPYVHDNRIVGVSSDGLDDPGIGDAIRMLHNLRKALENRKSR
jgi:hypothetical protein